MLRPIDNIIIHTNFYKYAKYHITNIEILRNINKCVLLDNVVMNLFLTLYALYCIILSQSSLPIPTYITFLMHSYPSHLILIMSINCFAAPCSFYLTKYCSVNLVDHYLTSRLYIFINHYTIFFILDHG